MKTKPYKFKIGQTVEYTHWYYEEETCECCGNTHENEIKELKTSTVVSRKRVHPINVYTISDFTLEEEFKVLPDGSKEYHPRIKIPEPPKYMYNNYTLEDGSKHFENKLTKK